jgi:hypothetical protein
MADLSPVVENFRRQIEITVNPWFRDHRFAGKIILPGVEILLILAREVKKIRPQYNVAAMLDAGFAKFFEIGLNDKKLNAIVDLVEHDDNKITARLFSRVRKKKISRLMEHGRVTFKQAAGSFLPFGRLTQAKPLFTVSAEKIYRELVPFGPACQNIIADLKLTAEGAWGRVQAPDFSDPEQANLCGSPFPFDAAMHAACVWGQYFADFIPFPVGFAERIINNPTRAGKLYEIKIISTESKPDGQLFDLWISDSHGKLFESVKGLQMNNIRGMNTGRHR